MNDRPKSARARKNNSRTIDQLFRRSSYVNKDYNPDIHTSSFDNLLKAKFRDKGMAIDKRQKLFEEILIGRMKDVQRFCNEIKTQLKRVVYDLNDNVSHKIKLNSTATKIKIQTV